MNYILRVFIQRGLGVLMFLLGSWWTMNLRAWVYFIGYFLITIISCYIMHNVNKETLAERGKINTDSPKWDKIILTIYWLLTFFIIYLVAGLEMNKADKPGIIFVIGIILQLTYGQLLSILFNKLHNNFYFQLLCNLLLNNIDFY